MPSIWENMRDYILPLTILKISMTFEDKITLSNAFFPPQYVDIIYKATTI